MELYTHDLKKSQEDIIATYDHFMANIRDNVDLANHYVRYLESIGRLEDAERLRKAIDEGS